MKTRELGKTGVQLSPLGLGCWQFSQGKGMVGQVWDTLAQDAMTTIVRTALDGGINWFDTAEVYGMGTSERALAQALVSLKKAPGEVFVASKWWPLLRTAKNLEASIDPRRAALAPYDVDLLQIHQPFSLSSVTAQAKALAHLMKNRGVKQVGVSNFSAKAMRRVSQVLQDQGLVLASNQVHYNLARRRIENDGTLETAKELGISIIAYSPLAQGLLTGRFHDDPAKVANIHPMRRVMSGINPVGLEKSRGLINILKEIASHHTTSVGPVLPGQVALNALVMLQGEFVFAIPGASKPQQVVEAAHALDFTLDTAELEAIDNAARLYETSR